VRVLLADDDMHVRSAVRLVLENEPGVLFVGDCDCAEGLVEQVRCSQADVVLLDWDLPGLRAGSLDHLRAAYPICRLVALSCRPEQRSEALRAGIDRFVSKGDAPSSLLRVLRELKTQTEADGQPKGDAGRPEAFEVVQDRVE
jgi:DNA-binding NarL/FixJ family response regulator